MNEQLTNEQWELVWQLVRNLEPHPQSNWESLAASAYCDPRIVDQALAVLRASTSWSGSGGHRPSAASATSWTGGRLRQYRVGPLLGLGGAGAVHVATDDVLNRLVALKFFSAQQLALPDVKERILSEARAASALNHPNIVTIFEVVETDEATAMAMELVDGATLRERCSGPQPAGDVMGWGLQLAQALAAAHARGLIHGDIKPENVMVRDDGLVKLLDFGLARDARLLAMPVAGTLRYLSPEQCRGEQASVSSDIFSFGVLLYELSTGSNPFDKGNLSSILQAILDHEPEPVRKLNPAIPRDTEALILAMLAKDPATRPDARTVADRLAPAPLRRANRLALAGGALGLAALAVAGAVYWDRTRTVPILRQITTNVHENRVTAAAMAPDASLLAFASTDKLWIRSLPNGQPEEIDTPPDLQISKIEWRPDQSDLLISGSSGKTFESSIWLVYRNGAAPKLVRDRAMRGALSSDGKRIGFITEDQAEIWVSDPDGGNARLAARTGGDLIGGLFWSPAGRLLYSREPSQGPDRLESLDVDSGETKAVYTNDEIASKGPMPIPWASFISGGRIVYLRYDPPNLYHRFNLWELRTDLTTGKALGRPRKLTGFDAELGSLSVSRDGTLVSAVKTTRADAVFVGQFDGASRKLVDSRRLTFDSSSIYPHAWTPDSKAILFESHRNGTYDLYRQWTSRQTPENLVVGPGDEFLPAVTPDGRWVIYCANTPSEKFNRIMRVPIDGGKPEQIGQTEPHNDIRCAYPGKLMAGAAPCVVRVKEAQHFRFVGLDPQKGLGKTIVTISRPNYFIFGDWDLSPAGTLVAMPNRDPRKNTVRVVPLHPPQATGSEREVEVIGRTNLHGIAWAADGSGWFITINSSIGRQLIHCDLNGRSVALGVSGWAVPAPDGRQIAYKDDLSVGNVYFVENLH